MNAAADMNVLVVDDEPGHAEMAAEALAKLGLRCMTATSGRDALRIVNDNEIDIVLTDLVMHGVTGMDVLKAAKQRHPDCEVIVISGQGGVQAAVDAMAAGAATYVRKPLRVEEVRAVVQKQVDKVRLRRRRDELERQVDASYGLPGVVGRSRAMRDALTLVRQVADTNATVLILGESGTGKEVIAQSVHRLARRRESPFVAINCAAMSETLLESELFGHEKGAFTGAVGNRRGKFEYAHGGTLFLDEIGDMPLPLQAKLLRVLESREVVRVGANEPIKVDVRIVAATNRDLEEAVKAGDFREDLYFRIKVVTVLLPPLRERREDVPLLVERFLQEFGELHGRPARAVTADAMARLMGYDWPGNVRQLKNAMETAVLVTPGEVVDVGNLPAEIQAAPVAPPTATLTAGDASGSTLYVPQGSPTFSADVSLPGPPTERGATSIGAPAGSGLLDGLVIPLEEAERILVRNALQRTGGNREQAARALGISERTLYRKINKWKEQVTG